MAPQILSMKPKCNIILNTIVPATYMAGRAQTLPRQGHKYRMGRLSTLKACTSGCYAPVSRTVLKRKANAKWGEAESEKEARFLKQQTWYLKQQVQQYKQYMPYLKQQA